MSGHSKWSKIKHKKGAKDAQRGKIFTKLAKDITLAAAEGGGDSSMNFSLRLVIDKAKQANMPKDNIDRAIKKGTGEIEGGQLTRVSYEGYGPAGSALIIDCTTDNTNRTSSEVRKLLEAGGGKWAQPNSVAWQFEEKGLIVVLPERKVKVEQFGKDDSYEKLDSEEVILEIMEIEGVEDVKESDEGEIEVFCSRSDLKKVNDAVENLKLRLESSELIKLAKDEVELDKDSGKKVEKLVEMLEEHDDVDSVWTNISM